MTNRGRRRATARRRGRGAGTAAALGAVGLIVLSGPATQVAAEATAAGTTIRTVPAPVAPSPAVPVPSAPLVPAPVPATPQATVAIPRPGPIDVAIRPPNVPVGVPLETAPPTATCGGYGNPRRINPTVVAGPGTAGLSWLSDGHAEVRGYRVQAVSQQLVPGVQPEPPRRTVAQPDDCVDVGVTFDGLTRGVPYVFWLEEEVQHDSGATRWIQVGTSAAVVIP